jgi:outer membrane protein assembly factor BamB
MNSSVFIWRAILAILLVSSHCIAQETPKCWPQFRGPGGLGIAGDHGYPVNFDANNSLIWKTSLPSGVSSPCIWEELIFLTGYDKQRKMLETICLDRTTGKIMWRQDAPAEQIESVHEVSSPANATPASDGEHVYVYFESYGLIAYDFDGNTVWIRKLPMMPSSFGSGTSPIVVNGLVILNRDAPMPPQSQAGDDQPKPELMAFDVKTGNTVWCVDRPASRVKYATPVVLNGTTGDEVVVLGGGHLTSYELSSGKVVWSIHGLPTQAVATPQIVDGHVYVTATGPLGEPEGFVMPPYAEFLAIHDQDGNGRLSWTEIPDDFMIIDRRASSAAGNSPLKKFGRGMDSNKNGEIEEDEWKGFERGFGGWVKSNKPGVFAFMPNGHGDITETSLIWRNERGAAEVPSLLVLNKKVFVIRNGGILHCRDVADGVDTYRGRLGAIGGYYASPVAADGNVYFTSDRGVVTVIDGKASELKVLARNDLGEPIMATPALTDGKVYIRTDQHLYAFGR